MSNATPAPTAPATWTLARTDGQPTTGVPRTHDDAVRIAAARNRIVGRPVWTAVPLSTTAPATTRVHTVYAMGTGEPILTTTDYAAARAALDAQPLTDPDARPWRPAYIGSYASA